MPTELIQASAAGVEPLAAYLARLPAPRSKAAMQDSLKRIARVLLNDERALAEDVPWAKLEPYHVDAILAKFTGAFAPATVNRHLSALRGMIKTLLRMQLIDADKAARLSDFKQLKNKRPLAGRCLSMDEIRALFAAAYGYPGFARDAAILALGYCAGLRRSEIAELRISNLNIAQGQVTVVGKGGKIRVVPLPAAALQHLNQLCVIDLAFNKVKEGALIRRLGSTGKPLGPLTDDGVYAVLVRLGKRAKLNNFSPHDLRRTYITELLDRGHDPITVARLAGHDDVKTTMLYDRRPERVARAAADSLDAEVPMPLPALEELFTASNALRTEELLHRLPVLRGYFDEGLCAMREVKLPALEACVDKSRTGLRGGDDHKDLCLIAIEWLRQRGLTDYRIEGEYVAGRFDVAVADHSLYIECGDTPATKVIACLEHNKPVMLVPFSMPPSRGFLFTRRVGSEEAWARVKQAQLDDTTNNAVFLIGKLTKTKEKKP